MVDDTSNSGEGHLAVVEKRDAFFVVRSDDPEDWLACFEKNPDFPSRAWAENMVHVFNRRHTGPRAEVPTPPGTRPSTYHPDAKP